MPNWRVKATPKVQAELQPTLPTIDLACDRLKRLAAFHEARDNALYGA